MVCGSMYHWVKDCPDRNAMYTACQEEEVQITLFSKTVQECYVENFLGETLSYAMIPDVQKVFAVGCGFSVTLMF